MKKLMAKGLPEGFFSLCKRQLSALWSRSFAASTPQPPEQGSWLLINNQVRRESASLLSPFAHDFAHLFVKALRLPRITDQHVANATIRTNHDRA